MQIAPKTIWTDADGAWTIDPSKGRVLVVRAGSPVPKELQAKVAEFLAPPPPPKKARQSSSSKQAPKGEDK